MARRSREPSGDYLSLVSLPRVATSPLGELSRRALLALGLLLVTTAIVYFDRDAYTDSADGVVSFVDALYYATVTITTTGYGDITPVAEHARIINALVVTPLRICFLVLLVGTTLEVLANEGRRRMRDTAWRKHMRNHTVVIGYGTKGRSAVATMTRHGVPLNKVVVLDAQPKSIADANIDGVAAFEGDATRRDLLRRAEISKAKDVIITLDRDDAAILATLTVRQLNPSANIVVSIREHENVPLVRQSGATSVVTSSDAVGRLMGLSAIGPHLGSMIQDLLSVGEGLEVDQRLAQSGEVGQNPATIPGERVIGIVRNDTLRRFYDPTAAKIEMGDELITVRRGSGRPADRLPERG